MYTKGRKKGYTIEMTLSSTMLKEMAFRLCTGLRRNVENHIKKHNNNSGGSSNGSAAVMVTETWVDGNDDDDDSNDDTITAAPIK